MTFILILIRLGNDLRLVMKKRSIRKKFWVFSLAQIYLIIHNLIEQILFNQDSKALKSSWSTDLSYKKMTIKTNKLVIFKNLRVILYLKWSF